MVTKIAGVIFDTPMSFVIGTKRCLSANLMGGAHPGCDLTRTDI